eukprot:CAMPEP_0115085216 /NCGR_PEP_ID=MMETSP0227-20121206/21789_1 /TAXON_ID=89957 /ORGANISM="Polarella glacialis, Strain CCMP 1383" /LENGTH=107 /DNA_ID=CAMNT_0002474303 /DNA_START=58 /DNA_END=382 /DNA_ORIENTATION=-
MAKVAMELREERTSVPEGVKEGWENNDDSNNNDKNNNNKNNNNDNNNKNNNNLTARAGVPPPKEKCKRSSSSQTPWSKFESALVRLPGSPRAAGKAKADQDVSCYLD